MKNAFTTLLLHLFLAISLLPQNGKPIYNLRCEREGQFIGNIQVQLFPLITPLHTHNFDSLVSIHFFDTTAFHRVVPNFVIQGGDPNSRHGDPSTWGNGDPSQTNVPAEFSPVVHARGILGAARDVDINSANSQFYINVRENSNLNGKYTAYGIVSSGMDIVDTIVNSPTVPGTERPVQKIEMFVTKIGYNPATPAPPVLSSPSNNQIGLSGIINFQWTAEWDAVLFRLQIAKDSLFTNLIYDEELGKTSRAVSDLEMGNIKYFWRVSANNGAFISQYSQTFSFITSIKAPELISPPDSSTGVIIDPLFKWRSVVGATGYRFQLATAATFFTSSLVYNVAPVTDTTFFPANLLPNKKYYWRVKGLTDTYEGIFSKTAIFTTGTSTDVDFSVNEFKYSLSPNYPNPFNPSTVISYSLAEKTRVSIKIFDMLGNEIDTLVDEVKTSGEHETTWNADSVPSGVYLYRLQAGKFTNVKKMILLR